jgi:hypothetical protein
MSDIKVNVIVEETLTRFAILAPLWETEFVVPEAVLISSTLRAWAAR